MPVFKEQDVIVCLTTAASDLTKGKEYEVIKYDPELDSVIIIDDACDTWEYPADSFKLKEEPMEEVTEYLVVAPGHFMCVVTKSLEEAQDLAAEFVRAEEEECHIYVKKFVVSVEPKKVNFREV